MRWAFALLSLAGCDLVFGLEGRSDAPAPGPDVAMATFTRLVLSEAGGEVVELPPGDDVEAEVVLANGVKPPIERDGGTFRFAWTRGTPYRLTFFIPGRAPLTYVTAADHLQHVQRELGRDGPEPAPGTLLDVTFMPQGTTLDELSTTGVWTTSLTIPPADSRIVADFAAPATFLTGTRRLLAPTDDVYCLGFATTSSDGLFYNGIQKRGSLRVAMTDGARTITTCTLQEVTPDRCAKMMIDRGAAAERVASATSVQFASPASETYVLALPSDSLGPLHGLRLAYENGGVPGAFVGDLAYTNPFVGHTQAVLAASTRTRYLYLGGKAYPLVVGTYQFYQPLEGCLPSPVLDEVAIPTQPSIGGVVLAEDGTRMLARSQPVEVAWDNATEGTVDYYTVQLSRLELANDATTLRELQVWVTTDNHVTMERSLFEDDKQYVISIGAAYGWPNAATGDFRTLRWPAPMSTSGNHSAQFSVESP